ncbi:DUF2752 domain-containing protein [Nonlabens spongiae]|nr:DUF2752 domain-containing protein [Nonlabens spongiae]
MLPCVSKKITGMDCPGCGIQRSISFLLKGELVDSFLMYPGLLPIATLFTFLVVDFFFTIKHSEKIKLFLTFFTLGTVVVSYIIKMVFLYL